MNWLRYGWHIPFAFIIGFGVYLLVLGWDPMKGNPPDQMPEPVSSQKASETLLFTITTKLI